MFFSVTVCHLTAHASVRCEALMLHVQHEFLELNNLTDATLLQKMNEILNKRSLFSLSNELNATPEATNSITFKYLQTSLPKSSATRLQSLNRLQAQHIYDKVKNHPVADRSVIYKYDPEGKIGFCFGRAMTAHLELIKFGVDKSRIRKLWVFGNLKSGSTDWGYHVTTIVKGPDNTWWTIDPIFNKPLTATEWFNQMKQYDSDGKMTIYTTEAKRFGPWIQPYTKDELNSDFYNGYFQDLLKSFKKTQEKIEPNVLVPFF